ncbi:MAG: hypothetical protein ACREO7_10270 [Pseudoxanthomonas sp.]
MAIAVQKRVVFDFEIATAMVVVCRGRNSAWISKAMKFQMPSLPTTSSTTCVC